VSFSATDCARARESLSAQLDGELPELELGRVEQHLLVCPSCSAWAEEVQSATLWLREAPLEEPAIRLAVPRRVRRRAAAPAALVAAAAASLLVVLGTSQSLTGSGQTVGSGRVSPQVSAPVIMSLESARLGLDSLPDRLSTVVVPQGFRAV
jgi:predicted anti-sigma-YlaC factor YlaD